MSTRFISARDKKTCVDYRKLNSQLSRVLGNESSGVITSVDTPKIDKMMAHMHDSKLKSGYCHINLSPETTYKCFYHYIWLVQIPQKALWTSTRTILIQCSDAEGIWSIH